MILIIGAGLSGLLTGYRLQEKGIPFKIIEARNRIGGRINTVTGTTNTPSEMGATWFTQQHTSLLALLEEVGLDYFTQHTDSTVFYQTSDRAPVQLVQIPNQPPSYRISGGTSTLINTLYKKLNTEDVFLNQSVKGIKFLENSVQVTAQAIFEGTQVVLAIPPKLWAHKILFEPPLPKVLLDVAKYTHTWMEDAIKVALTYSKPFWKDEKLPGTLYSNTGPVTELYDHCNHKQSTYALCGFVNSGFKNLKYEERRARVIDQVTTIFGASAEAFIDYEECVWSNEENTFEASDRFLFPHQNNGNPIFRTSFFNDRLLLSSAESASEFAGYMEGAVRSGHATANKIVPRENGIH